MRDLFRKAVNFIGLLGLLVGLLSGCGSAQTTTKPHLPLDTSVKKKKDQPISPVKNKATSYEMDSMINHLKSPIILEKQKAMILKTDTQNDYEAVSQWLEVTNENALAFATPHSKTVKESFSEDTGLKAVGKRIVDGDLWYLIDGKKNQKDWISSDRVKVLPQPSVLLNTPLINQMPELSRGCEVTSLAMLIQQAGKKTSKLKLAKEIKKVPFESDGYRGNPNDGFVGNIYTFHQPGLGVYHRPIAALAKSYLGNRVIDLTGEGWASIQKQLDSGYAVWVITNVTFGPLSNTDPYWYTWKTKEGTIRITYKEHSVLVTGYGPHSVYINDPLGAVKNKKLDKEDFVAAWKQMGSQAISYK